MLALSGGGSHGAFGAGVLIGWTKSGSRPQFDVVTGISTGALIATFAFLGSDYDDGLRLYTEVSNKDIYRKRGRLKGLFSDAFVDTAPLRQLIADQVTEETLAQVALAHAAGRRLFVGTVNLDANAFTVWDMGAIAVSDRPDKLQRYRDVILASASLPVFFPPVYIPVDIGEERYWQMHVDGGVREPVFFYDFVEELVQAFAEVGLDIDKEVHPEFFVLHNGTLYAEATYKPVKPRSLSIARASVDNLMRKNTVSSLYRLWVQAMVYGADFHIAYIPPEFDVDWGATEFDPEKMRRLFDFAYQRAAKGTAFVTQRAVSDYDELIRLLDPMQVLDPLEARPQFRLEEK
jgi:predicted acylesterase/phospholipase RssA